MIDSIGKIHEIVEEIKRLNQRTRLTDSMKNTKFFLVKISSTISLVCFLVVAICGIVCSVWTQSLGLVPLLYALTYQLSILTLSKNLLANVSRLTLKFLVIVI
jgi:hypothetical protein